VALSNAKSEAVTEYWFVPKTYGYGATPSNWKGWAAIAVFVLAAVAVTLTLLVWPVNSPAGPTTSQLALWLLVSVAMTVAFARFCQIKTDGQWKWRWGK
jgi:hypothetical protein